MQQPWNVGRAFNRECLTSASDAVGETQKVAAIKHRWKQLEYAFAENCRLVRVWTENFLEREKFRVTSTRQRRTEDDRIPFNIDTRTSLSL